jgi:CHASE2 domain-containing sensor protein
MRLTLLTFIVFTVFVNLSACSSQSSQLNLEKRKDDIVLINIYGERCEVSELLNLVSKKKPRVIGVNFLYREEKEGKCDSLLQQSLKNSENVILIEGHRDGNEIRSNDKFVKMSMQSAQAGFLGDGKDQLYSYYRVRMSENGLRYSFPFEIASAYDTSDAVYLASISKPKKDYPINFRYQKTDFKILNGLSAVDASENLLKDKIVLIGLFESGDEDLFLTPTNQGSSKTYGTVILANIILNILEDLDNPEAIKSGLNKYTEHILKNRNKKSVTDNP